MCYDPVLRLNCMNNVIVIHSRLNKVGFMNEEQKWMTLFYMERHLAQKLVCRFSMKINQDTKKERNSKITKKSTIYKNLLQWSI